MSSHFFLGRLQAVPSDKVDELTGWLFEQGASGVEENLEFSQTPGTYEPVVVEKSTVDLNVYFESSPPEELKAQLVAEYGLSISIEKQQNQDWQEEWKKGFHSFCLVKNYWVVPTWENPPAEAKEVIRIDPGMAFGTGTHETTQLMADLLHQHLTQESPESLLDVGAGTGILAILATKMGVERVGATEIDGPARAVCKENILANQSSAHVFDEQVEELESDYDVVVANIIDGVLTSIRSSLFARCRQDLFLSGILVERKSVFEENFLKEAPFHVVTVVTKGEWLGYHLRRL